MSISIAPNIKRFGLSNNQLKIIAMLTMLIDHFGLIFMPSCILLRIVGRLSFPIFAYMIAEGCLHTKNRTKYLLMIAVLGLLCQVVYYVYDGSLYLSVLITFSLSISTIFAIDNFIKKRSIINFLIAIAVVGLSIFASGVAPVIFKNYGYDLDYGYLGVLMPVAIYYAKNKWLKLIVATAVIIAMGYLLSNLQFYALISVPLLALYNGKRGRFKLKFMFYIFYPLHLALLQGIYFLTSTLK